MGKWFMLDGRVSAAGPPAIRPFSSPLQAVDEAKWLNCRGKYFPFVLLVHVAFSCFGGRVVGCRGCSLGFFHFSILFFLLFSFLRLHRPG
jgi:hypothetical protein